MHLNDVGGMRGNVLLSKGMWRAVPETGQVSLSEQTLARIVNVDPIEKWYILDPEPIARGQFATVYHCRHRVTGEEFAVKFASRRRLGADATPDIIHEIAVNAILASCSHNVKLHDVFTTDSAFVLIMEYAPGGDLQTLLDENLVPYERDVIGFLRQLLEGLVFIHDRSLVHLDIKPQNLVLMGEFPDCAVKLCDFEISRLLTPGFEVREILGTPDYVAPEILHYEPITTSTDMWSLGVLTYVLLTGFLPFGGDNDQETFMQISRGELDFPNELFEDITPEAIDFMKKLLVRQPERRMSARECLAHPWMKAQVTRPPPPTTLDLPTAVHALPSSHTPFVSRAESSPSVIVTTVSKGEDKTGEESDSKTPSTPITGRPPLHPRSSLKSMSAATEVTSDSPTNPSTPGATLPGITPFLNKESKMGSRQNLNKLRTMSKSREVLSERIQMSNLKKTLSKSRERLYDAKLGLSTSREDLLTCQSLSQSVEALTALSRLHENGALYNSCNNIFIPMIHLVNKDCNKPDRMYKSMASIDQIPGNDLSKTMGYFESRVTGDDDYNDVITRRNTSLNMVISDSPSEGTQKSTANEEARLGGLRGNPCRGGRSAEGNDRICPRHSHKQPEPQATQKINKMSRADKMKKDAQRRRKEREQREKDRNRKTSLVETKTQEGSTSPTVRRGSVCHVELRLQERHERLIEKQEREGRKMSSTGSRRLSSIDSDKSPGPDATKPSTRRSSTLTAKTERSRSITPTRRRSSKVESPKSSDVSEASSMESVSGSLESVQSKGTDKRRKSKQLTNSRRVSTTTKMQKSNDENGNVIQETSTTPATERVPALSRDQDEAYNSLEEGSREITPEEEKSDGDADSVESDRTCTGSVVEVDEPSTPTEEVRIITTKASSGEDAQNSVQKEVKSEEEQKGTVTSKPCSSSLEVPGLGDIQEESGTVKYARSTSTTSDLGGSICEESEDSSEQALLEIEMKIFENKARARSMSVHSKPALSVLPRVRNRSNSMHQTSTVTDRARPWGEICSGSVAKALKNFSVQEEQDELNAASDLAKRRQSSPPHFPTEETGSTEVESLPREQ